MSIAAEFEGQIKTREVTDPNTKDERYFFHFADGSTIGIKVRDSQLQCGFKTIETWAADELGDDSDLD